MRRFKSGCGLMKGGDIMGSLSELLKARVLPDEDWFIKNKLPYPANIVHDKRVNKKVAGYSQTMRLISSWTDVEIAIANMFWGIARFEKQAYKDAVKAGLVSDEFLQEIPRLSITTKNAVKQTLDSVKSADSRKEWADRVEGKAVSREVSINSDVDQEEQEIEKLRQNIMEKFDLLGDD